MIRKCLPIRDDFDLYNRLLEKEKFIDDKLIELVDASSTWRRQDAKVRHDSDEEILFSAAKQKTGSKYGLKIFIKSLFDEPVFYFDSDGPAHFNFDSPKGLSGSQIDTPHFNFYDNEGVKRARRTDFIEGNVTQLQSDINFGMKYFCQEAKLNKDSHIPVIREGWQFSIFDDANDDIHEGIDFLDE